jgi:uncharacterized damage-inducible protein DinB
MMRPQAATEVWQRGPVDGVPALLMPVAHALLQSVEDLERVCGDVPAERLWEEPAGAASLAFHLQHVAGATDRLFTYARGERLTEAQLAALAAEARTPQPLPDAAMLLARVKEAVDRALRQLRHTAPESLLEARAIGRAGLPTTTIGLLFHAAEHAMRHVGQAIVTARFVDRSLNRPPLAAGR